MADEFIKGLGALTGAGLAWMVLAGWFRTPGFESTQQLVAPVTVSPGSADLLTTIAITLMDVFFWFALLGAFAFWVLIPATRQLRETVSERRDSG
ncbi:MAG: hypothetical protein ABEJ34_03320 [Haloferacaceae archaeon]